MFKIIKKKENNVSPLTTYSFTNFKVGRKGVCMYITRTCLHDNFQILSYIFKLLIKYLYLCSRGVTPRTPHREVQGSNPVRFFLFILCFFSSFFFHLLFWFGSLMFCLSVCLLLFFLMVTVNRRGHYL